MATCMVEDGARIVGSDSATGHDDDATFSLLVEAAQQVNALLGLGLLSRSKNALAAQVDDLLQRSERVAAPVNGTVKSHWQAMSGIHHAPHGGHIYVAVGREGTTDDAIAPWQGSLDVAYHHLHLMSGVDKTTLAQADKRMNAQVLEPIPHML